MIQGLLQRKRRDDERGAVTVIVAISLVVIMVSIGLSFDLGRLVDTNRSMQSVADTVALTTADALNGESTQSIVDASNPGENVTLWSFINSEAVADATANGFTPSSANVLTVSAGTWTSSGGFSAISGCTTSTPSSPGTSCTSGVPNAVRITAAQPTKFAFMPGSPTSTRQATAARNFNTPTTSCNGPQCNTAGTSGFTVGAYLANIDSTSGPLLNALFNQTLGTSFNLTAANYQGLAAGSIALGDLITANPTLGSMSNVLSTSYSPKTLLGYYANALSYRAAQYLNAGQPTAAAALQTAASTLNTVLPLVTSTASIQLCQMINVSPGTNACKTSDPSAASASVSALSILQAAAEVANGSHALSFNAGAAGVLTVSLSAISPISTSWCSSCNPPSTDGPAQQTSGTWATTATNTQAQVTISANAQLVSVGLSITGATATGNLTAVTCGPTQAAGSATIGVTTNAAVVSPTVSILGLGLVSATVAGGGTSNSNPTSLTFNGPITAQTPSQTVSPTSVPLSVSGSVLGLLNVNLQNVLGGLNPVLSPLLTALGVSVGGAVVQDSILSCGSTLVG